nr:Ig-like domain-containing protein [uncultured Halomonas sp.]
MRKSNKKWLPALAAALIIASPMAIAAGLSYQDPPADQQRGEQRERPTLISETQGSVSSGTVTDATGQAQRSTWSAWESDSQRRSERLNFQGGGNVDSTVSPSSMLSGRLEWGNDAWSECKTSASNEYCGTMVSGLRERSVWCQFDRANGQSGTASDGLCLTAQGAKPETTRSCQMEITSDCVHPPIIVSLEGAPQGPFLADGSDSVTLTATVRRTTGEVAAGETVSWTTSRGTLNRQTTTTNSSGVTSVTLRSDSIGIATVRAQANDSRMNVGVEFVTPVPDFVGLTASPSSGIIANGSDRSTVTAILQYANGKRASGKAVSFTTSRGNLSAGSATTDAQGRATVTLSSTNEGVANITARHSSSSASTAVTFDRLRTMSIASITASPNNGILADGTDYSNITATVRYDDGEPAGGEVVSFSRSMGFLSANSATTNGSGQATVRHASNTTGTSVVTATYGGSSRSTNVGFVTASETAYSNNTNDRTLITWYRGACYAPGAYPRQHYAEIMGYEAAMTWKGAFDFSTFTYTNTLTIRTQSSTVPSSIVFEDANYTYRTGRVMKAQIGCPPGQEVFAPPRQVYEWEVIRTPK